MYYRVYNKDDKVPKLPPKNWGKTRPVFYHIDEFIEYSGKKQLDAIIRVESGEELRKLADKEDIINKSSTIKSKFWHSWYLIKHGKYKYVFY